MKRRLQSDNCDYSDWREGAELIARQWLHEREDKLSRSQRPYTSHKHYRGQLICIDEGLIQVNTEEGTWLLPPHRAGWIPPEAMHSVYFHGSVKGWSLLLLPSACHQLPKSPCVIGMNDVIKVLANRILGWSKTTEVSPDQSHILCVILNEIRRAPHENLYFPLPRDPRLQRIAHSMLDNLGSTKSVEHWASIGATSSRTLRRLVRTELNMSFNMWRQQIQLIHAMEMLARGKSVGDVSFALGYATPSNFIAMFRKVYGESPARYFSKRPAKYNT
ncbi:Transcriptional regulator, AraC family [Grimontia indica]|uniref:Transcriptional regulator, AraC family n=2 Tax=Grimontia TaxID=246861 RepID=R1IU63_9GAMM|nr:Transcriptional regulator, AraC family [Grimontia indica]